MNILDPDGNYKKLLLSQYNVSSDFEIEEVGKEVSHIDEDSINSESESLPIHHLRLPVGYILISARFSSKNLRFFIVEIK